MANNYLTYDGIDGLVTVPDDAALDFGTGDFSICFWAYNLYEVNTSSFIYKSGLIPLASYGIIVSPRGFLSLNTLVVAPPTISAECPIDGRNKWTHIVIVRSGTDVKFYIDSSLKTTTGSASAGNLDNTGDLIIGELFHGSLDDLRIYKKALTAGEVATIYNGGAGKKYEAGDVTGASAVVAFDFDEGVGNPQSQGTVLTGTITGGVTWQSGGTPFKTGGGGIFMDIFDELWLD